MNEAWRRAREASGNLARVRDAANGDAAAAIRALERRLVEALGDDALYGLPNLTPDLRGQEMFRGLRVNNARTRFGPAEFVPRDGREVLALSICGILVAVHRDASEVVVRPVDDEELRADLLRPFFDVVQQALDAHVARTDRRIKSYEALSDLARRMTDVLGPALR